MESKIIPTYYEKDNNGLSIKWIKIMKNSIITTGGKYSTSRMLADYTNNLYMPLCNLTKKYYEKVVYLKSNIQTNYMCIIKSEIFDEDNYHPKAVFANVHVYMKPLSNDSFLSLAHNNVSKLYMPKNENVDLNPINETKDAFTPPDNNEDVKE